MVGGTPSKRLANNATSHLRLIRQGAIYLCICSYRIKMHAKARGYRVTLFFIMTKAILNPAFLLSHGELVCDLFGLDFLNNIMSTASSPSHDDDDGNKLRESNTATTIIISDQRSMLGRQDRAYILTSPQHFQQLEHSIGIYLSINLPFCILDYRLSHQKQRPKALRQDWVFILTSPQITNN